MTNQEKVQGLITRWKVNKAMLARKLIMPISTLGNKLDPKQKKYRLTDDEAHAVEALLVAMALDILNQFKSKRK